MEFNYFDLDFRSEFSAVHQTKFTAMSLDVWRVHFFGGDAPTGKRHLRSFIVDRADEYLGYITIRPDKPPSIGRSVIAPRQAEPEFKDAAALASCVRTFVVEHVNVFGVPLVCRGVPFMEGDGHLLRCGHVTAWMAHYTAVLKGWVGRQTSASFAAEHEVADAFGRTYPSLGLTGLGQTHILRRAGLPPEVLDFAEFDPAREVRWTDRPALAVLKEGPDSGIALATESLTETVARYLNSGIPCILNMGDHSLLICGYYRASDLVAMPSGQDPAAIVGFLVQDDENGPFRVRPVKEIWAEGNQDYVEAALCVPLPRGLWLSDHVAHDIAVDYLETLIVERRDVRANHVDSEASSGSSVTATGEHPDGSDAAAGGGGQDAGVVHEATDAGVSAGATRDPSMGDVSSPPTLNEEGVERLQELAAAIESGVPSDYFVRSYAQQGADFKTDFIQRLNHPASAHVVGYTYLPKYVWVVELLDRRLHQAHEPAVVATIVLDASTGSPTGTLPQGPLLLHLPGEILQMMEDDKPYEDTWHQSRSNPYASGRWHEGTPESGEPNYAVPHRSKNAM